jgi:hypothetical protein
MKNQYNPHRAARRAAQRSTAKAQHLNELGQQFQAQASKLVKSGYAGIGYMLGRKSNGKNRLGGYGDFIKRVASDEESGKEMDAWMLLRISQGYMPLFRYYFSESDITNKTFKNHTVYRGRMNSYYTVVEVVPTDSFNGTSKNVSRLFDELYDDLGRERAADELSSTIGMKLMYF